MEIQIKRLDFATNILRTHDKRMADSASEGLNRVSGRIAGLLLKSLMSLAKARAHRYDASMRHRGAFSARSGRTEHHPANP
jgi:hypothetical protein